MANTFIVEQSVAATGLALLTREIVLPATVYRSAQSGFQGGSGSVINIRKPASLTSRVYNQTLRGAGTPITLDDATETSVPLSLTNIVYSAVAVTDEDLTLNIVDFGRQVLNPMVKAVGVGIENVLATVMNALTGGEATVAGGGDIHEVILEARRLLNVANVPMGDRFLAVSPDVEAKLLQDPENRLIRYEASGDSPNSALRDAQVGRLYGFTVVTSNALTANTAIAYHMDAFAFASVALAIPAGVSFGQAISDSGLAMRYVRDYDTAFQRDRAIVSTLAGASLLDANRAVKITLTPAA